MYESLNKYSIIDVIKILLNEISAYKFTYMQLIDIFIKYIAIPFFTYFICGLIFFKSFKKINLKNIIIITIESFWLIFSLPWVIITSLMDASHIVVFAPTIPVIVWLIINWIRKYLKCIQKKNNNCG